MPILPEPIAEALEPDAIQEEAVVATTVEEPTEATSIEEEPETLLQGQEFFDLPEAAFANNVSEEQGLPQVVQFEQENGTITSALLRRNEFLAVTEHNEFTVNTGEFTEKKLRQQQSAFTTLTLRNLAQEVDDSQNDITESQKFTTQVLGTTVTLSSGLSVGYILWLLRGGTLLASVMASLPAWRAIDPLPVLGTLGGDDDSDTETLESMVEESDDKPADDQNDADAKSA